MQSRLNQLSLDFPGYVTNPRGLGLFVAFDLPSETERDEVWNRVRVGNFSNKEQALLVKKNIESLIGEFAVGELDTPTPVGQIPAGELMIEEAPSIELPIAEPTSEKHAPAVEELSEEPIAQAAPDSEPTPEIEEIVKETTSDEEEGGEGEDEEEEGGEGEDEEEEGGEGEDEEDK